MKIDITGQKVLIPALLFAVLSPGILLSLPSLKLMSGETSLMSVLIHAVVLSLLYFVIAKYVVKVSLTKADLMVPALLFVLLSPGMLVTIPPGSFLSGMTGRLPVAVHTFVFAVLFATLRSVFPQYY
jgi:uncharacterized membrane protein